MRADLGQRSDGIKRWLRDSVRWREAETASRTPLQRASLAENGKVTEYFSRWSEGQHLYEFSEEDFTLYPQVWKGEMGLNRYAALLYEYACHEGNHSFLDILAGTRCQELDGHTVQDDVAAQR